MSLRGMSNFALLAIGVYFAQRDAFERGRQLGRFEAHVDLAKGILTRRGRE
jgi:hypothetical protein